MLRSMLRDYVMQFNHDDEETFHQAVSNADAYSFLSEQIPLLECPDKDLEKTYYFRWWVYRKHIKETPVGHIITEFLPSVPWAGPYNSINCPVGYHIREGRWLKDTDSILKEYIDFWLSGAGRVQLYSSWLIWAVWEYCCHKDDISFAIERLPQLIDFFEIREKEHQRSSGLYWSSDNLDGMEYSISGPGLRPTLNSYAWADAVAISHIAAAAGDDALSREYAEKAAAIKEKMDSLLWDDDFYKAIPQNKDAVSPPASVADVKELIGFIPWFFYLPDKGKEYIFSMLTDPEEFYAAAGLTTAQQKHPRFLESLPNECHWNGYVWPFATSYTLVAASNVLRKYPKCDFTKADFYHLLRQYALCHRRVREDGKEVAWIDENLHPYTGVWDARETLKNWGWLPEKGGIERGKDYNHSLFCDLVLSGLFGISVENGSFVCDPLIPEDWDYFRVENLWLKGQRYCIVFDRDGKHYGKGKGLQILQN